MACRLFTAKPSHEPMATSYLFDHYRQVWWNFNHDTTILIPQNSFRNVLAKLSAIRLQCVNSLRPSDAYMLRQSNHHWFRSNSGILLIRPLGTNFNEFLIEILIFSFKKMRLKMSSAKCCPFRLGLNVSTVPKPMPPGTQPLMHTQVIPETNMHVYIFQNNSQRNDKRQLHTCCLT